MAIHTIGSFFHGEMKSQPSFNFYRSSIEQVGTKMEGLQCIFAGSHE